MSTPTRFHAQETWPRIRALAKGRGRAFVAVPFVATGAANRLRLTKGDVLVARCDEPTVRAGLTNPTDIVKFIKRGVEVHNWSSLHAKVYVFGKTALVGSANISGNSEDYLLEAAVETTSPALVKQCREFVLALRGDFIELPYAKALIKQYRPPRIPGGHRAATRRTRPQSEMIAVLLKRANYDDIDQAEEDKAFETGRSRMTNEVLFSQESFRWMGAGSGAFQIGHRVLQIFRDGARREVEPPGRIVAIRRYRHGSQTRVMVAFEQRKRLRTKSMTELLRRVGAPAGVLRRLKTLRALSDPELVRRLGLVWPNALG